MVNPMAAHRRRASDGLTAWLESYQPRSIDIQRWGAIRPFVVALAGGLEFVGPVSGARTVRVLVRLVAWCVGEGIPLEVEVVLDPDTVERFVALGLADDRSRATYRAVLRRVGC